MIKILIVDDSDTETQLLKHIFSQAADIEVVGYARNGKDAIYLANKLKPDLITMDIQMPIMNGIEAIRQIMSHQPVPIVVITSKLNSELNLTFNALEAGALSVLAKPENVTGPNFAEQKNRIIDTVRSLSEIKVIKRRFFTKPHQPKNIKLTKEIISKEFIRNYEMIAIGVSVGGPQVLKSILSSLPPDFPVPIVVVQHMSKGFISDFAKWLNDNIKLQVKEAVNLEILKPGTVYFAPDDHHLEINRNRQNLIARFSEVAPISGFCPSATVLFHSVAKTCSENAIGILLTGMGNDGADGLLAIKKAKGHTLIQDQESSIVFGMAGAAQELGAVDKVIKLEKMAEYLVNVTSKSGKT